MVSIIHIGNERSFDQNKKGGNKMALTNYPIDSALEAAEKEILIDIVHPGSGAMYAKAPVFADNTLGQVVKEYGPEIGINPNAAQLIFVNKRTEQSTNDLEVSIGELGLQDGDVLCINDDGNVAGDEDAFDIDITHPGSGAMYAKAPVFAGNTLGQVVKEYGPEVGVNPDDPKLIFVNKRTEQSTSDLETTVSELGLQDGDVLCINDDAKVAGEKDVFGN